MALPPSTLTDAAFWHIRVGGIASVWSRRSQGYAGETDGLFFMNWWDRDRAIATTLIAQTGMNRSVEAVLNPYKEAIFLNGRAIKNALVTCAIGTIVPP
jgi:hypothetical protein